jgi:hypothetical protein
MSWTPNTLKTHLAGELNIARSVSGSEPDRLLTRVNDARKDVWRAHDWRFRRKKTTFVTVANTNTVALPSDFHKLDQRWVIDNDKSAGRKISFTDDIEIYEENALSYGTSTDEPKIALIKSTLTSAFAESILLTPTPDDAYTYDYWYYCLMPSVADDASPIWPEEMFDGWYRLARVYAFKAFRRDKAWREDWDFYQEWLQEAIEKHDETFSDNTPLIEDATGDGVYFGDTRGWYTTPWRTG